ncbi:hypothetical protein FoTM2_013701 [Fusarium oxysporum f. sp. vasinfectum]|nr:hypothetical protein FoTM2_013438 [Fusarium oxysporum f. sp. vasinfectum]KAK2926831.1 hypothetical protein FoTM2_013701 [Fusarium oxysporum f. sp. vasinfectum]
MTLTTTTFGTLDPLLARKPEFCDLQTFRAIVGLFALQGLEPTINASGSMQATNAP